MTNTSLWDSCLRFFENSLPSQQFNSWIKPLVFEMEGNKIILAAPNGFTLKIIQERFLPEIYKQAEAFLAFKPTVELRLRKSLQPPAILHDTLASTPAMAPASNTDQKSGKRHNKINPALSFDNFVLGKANQLAHAAALQVAESPATSYNPLFVYGGVGLGKTHLIQAIGNHIKKQNPQAKICYVHATNYVSDVVRAFQTKNFDEFKQFYNSLDLLLIDDIQFIADKPGT